MAELNVTVGAVTIAPVVLINSTLGIETKFVPAIDKEVSLEGSPIREEVEIVGRSPSPVGIVPEAPNATVIPLKVTELLESFALVIDPANLALNSILKLEKIIVNQ